MACEKDLTFLHLNKIADAVPAWIDGKLFFYEGASINARPRMVHKVPRSDRLPVCASNDTWLCAFSRAIYHRSDIIQDECTSRELHVRYITRLRFQWRYCGQHFRYLPPCLQEGVPSAELAVRNSQERHRRFVHGQLAASP